MPAQEYGEEIVCQRDGDSFDKAFREHLRITYNMTAVFVKIMKAPQGSIHIPFHRIVPSKFYVKIETANLRSMLLNFWRFNFQNCQKCINIDPEMKMINYSWW